MNIAFSPFWWVLFMHMYLNKLHIYMCVYRETKKEEHESHISGIHDFPLVPGGVLFIVVLITA